MRSASDGVRLAWRSCLSFSGEAAKKLFACSSAFHTVALSPPLLVLVSVFFYSASRFIALRLCSSDPTDCSHPSDVGEESRYPYPPLLPAYFPLSPPAADKRRLAARLSWQPRPAAQPAFHSLATTTTSLPPALPQARASRCATETLPPLGINNQPLPPSLTTTHSFHSNQLHPPAANILRTTRQHDYEQFYSAVPNANCLRFYIPL